jgi:hypothetical protein
MTRQDSAMLAHHLFRYCGRILAAWFRQGGGLVGLGRLEGGAGRGQAWPFLALPGGFLGRLDRRHGRGLDFFRDGLDSALSCVLLGWQIGRRDRDGFLGSLLFHESFMLSLGGLEFLLFEFMELLVKGGLQDLFTFSGSFLLDLYRR